MKTYNVVFEISIQEDSPFGAAKEVEKWLQDPGDNRQYYVQDVETKDLFSVDLNESDEDAVIQLQPKDYVPPIHFF